MIRKVLLPVLVSVILCCCLCACGTKEELVVIGTEAGTIEMIAQEKTVGTNLIPCEDEMMASEEKNHTSVIYVYVCGAVKTPGVYELPEGSRGEAALRAAGGFEENAATSYVNLASVLKDGEKLYFPTLEENIQATNEVGGDGKVNINRASVKELCSLPGIGESRAMDIVNYREEHGAFGTCEDIMKISGIKESVYQKIKDRIIVD